MGQGGVINYNIVADKDIMWCFLDSSILKEIAWQLVTGTIMNTIGVKRYKGGSCSSDKLLYP